MEQLERAVAALLRAVDQLPIYPRPLKVSTALCEAKDALHAIDKEREVSRKIAAGLAAAIEAGEREALRHLGPPDPALLIPSK